MSYCSLDEAWDLCRPTNNDTPPENTTLEIGGYQLNADPVSSSHSDSINLSMKQLPSSRMESDFAVFLQNKDDNIEQHKDKMREMVLQDKDRICTIFLKHLDDCPECREKMMKRFGNQMIEKFENLAEGINNPNYFEIFTIILVGIILIIIMDSFVRLGKMMKK